MAYPDAFALKNSGLNAFLFADVGTELNGSRLTILSVLARLGQDPWAEATRWAKLPKAAAVDCLAQSITRMPLGPQALADARATAARLILLLPSQTQKPAQSTSATVSTAAAPNWLAITFLYGALAFGLAVNMIMMPRPPAAVATPIEQTVHHTL
jgi:hypothetical protein